MSLLKCNNCGKKYNGRIRKNRKSNFCSHACYAESLKGERRPRKPDIVICDNCKKDFHKKNKSSNHNFCHRNCYNEYRMENNITGDRIKKVIHCKECNTEIITTYHAKIFCSIHCRNVYQRRYDCEYCNIEYYAIYSAREQKQLFGNIGYCSDNCEHSHKQNNELARRKAISKAFTGSKHPNYRHGIKKRRYSTDEISWAKLSEKIRRRDNHQCQGCLILQSDLNYKLHVHHIKPFVACDSIKEANNKNNLISLCNGCHTTADWIAVKQYPELGELGKELHEDQSKTPNKRRRN